MPNRKFIVIAGAIVVVFLGIFAFAQTGGESPNENSKPTITLIGDEVVTIDVGTSYDELGVTATDKEDGNISGYVEIESDLNVDVPGTYTIIYKVTDAAGNTVTKKRTVIVRDNNAPTITLNGEKEITIYVGDEYEELGATAKDEIDGVVEVITTGNVDTSKSGTYTITYKAVDSEGNESTETRTVIVIESSIARVVINSNKKEVMQGSNLQLTPVVTVNGNLDKTVTWSVNDSSGKVKVDKNGLVTVADDAKAGNYIVTATSTVDNTKKGTYIINVKEKVVEIFANLSFVGSPTYDVRIKVNGKYIKAYKLCFDGKCNITPNANGVAIAISNLFNNTNFPKLRVDFDGVLRKDTDGKLN